MQEGASPSELMIAELGKELSVYDATIEDEGSADPPPSHRPSDGREGHALGLGLGIDMLPKIVHKPKVLWKEVSAMCRTNAALRPRDQHRGMFAKRTILERFMENSRARRDEDKHWCFTPIVFLKTSKSDGVFTRVVIIFDQKGAKQKSHGYLRKSRTARPPPCAP